MDPIERIEKASAVCAEKVNAVTEGDLDKQTPCAEFKLKDLLNHIIGGLEMLRDAASGGKPAMPSGDQFGADPGKEYNTRRDALLATLREPGVLDRNWEMPFGSLPGSMMASIAFLEHLTHAWDVAKTIGAPTELPSDLVEELDGIARPMDAMLRMPGVCGPAVDAPANASETDKLMAFLGRQP